MSDLVKIQNELQTSISDFNEPFTEYLIDLMLPVEGILAPIKDREIIINSIETEINKIKPENRGRCCILDPLFSICCCWII